MFKKQRNILDIGDWAKFSIFWGRLGLSHFPPKIFRQCLKNCLSNLTKAYAGNELKLFALHVIEFHSKLLCPIHPTR